MIFPPAQKLILDVLKLNQPCHSHVKHLIQLGDLFNITENTIRVTLARLRKQHLITSSQRGFYTIATMETPIEQELWHWRQSEQVMKTWQGQYIVVLHQNSSKDNQAIQTKNQKALMLMGFSAFEQNIYIRPNNLIYTPKDIKDKLVKLGMTTQLSTFTAHGFETSDDHLIKLLWQPENINRYYIEHEHKMREWMLHQHLYPQKKLMQESYLLCQNAIRHILFDPLLPEPYIQQDIRQDFINMTVRFERNGVKIWRDYCDHRKTSTKKTTVLLGSANVSHASHSRGSHVNRP